jgi:hypothetical protein
MRSCLFVLAVLSCVAACTLLNSQAGLVGPPLEPDAGAGGSGGETSDGGSAAVPATDGSSDGHGDSGAQHADASNTGPPHGDGGLQEDTGATSPGDGGSVGDGGPIAIYTARPSPLGIGVYSGTICWVEGATASSIVCGSTGGDPSSINVVATSTGDPLAVDAFDVALDGTYYYWSNGPHNQVVQKPIAGGASAQYFTGDNWVSYIVRDFTNANVWASDWGNGGTEHVVVGPSQANPDDSTLVYTDTQVAGVALYSNGVYWGAAGSVSFGPEAGNATPTQVTTSGAVTGLATDGATGTAYFIVGNQQIYKLLYESNMPQLIYDAGSSFGVSDLAVDDAVYWSENANGQIMRMPK